MSAFIKIWLVIFIVTPEIWRRGLSVWVFLLNIGTPYPINSFSLTCSNCFGRFFAYHLFSSLRIRLCIYLALNYQFLKFQLYLLQQGLSACQCSLVFRLADSHEQLYHFAVRQWTRARFSFLFKRYTQRLLNHLRIIPHRSIFRRRWHAPETPVFTKQI